MSETWMQRGWRFLFYAPGPWGFAATLIFEPRDLWIGVYWDRTRIGDGGFKLAIYLCLLPLLPVRLSFWKYPHEIEF